MSDTTRQAVERERAGEEQRDAPAGASENGEQATPGANAPGDAARVFGEAFADAAEQQHAGRQDAEQQDAGEVQHDISELVKKAKQRDEYLALAQRTQADFENYRKRVAKDAASAQERGAVGLAKELLPALDNLDRALEAAAQDDPLLQGVKLVREELVGALARCGIEAFSPLGEPFDPELHEAVATAPAPAGRAPGTVVEVYQVGYRLRDSVIRPARVVVAA